MSIRYGYITGAERRLDSLAAQHQLAHPHVWYVPSMSHAPELRHPVLDLLLSKIRLNRELHIISDVLDIFE